jgi:para-nitrobenzyl esterase
MIGYWTAFAHRGDPNRAGLPRWAIARPGSAPVVGLDSDAIGRTPFAADHRCGFWDSL